jgi:cell wall assembly regulator SMI1
MMPCEITLHPHHRGSQEGYAVQKFTRPITREIELAGNRLALTFTEQGISIRLVGTRRPPWEISWGSVLCHIAGRHDAGATAPAEEIASAIEQLKKGAAPPSPSPAMPAAERNSASPAAPPGPLPEPSALQVLLERFDAWLKRHRSRYWQGLQSPAPAEELAALASALNHPVPEALGTLLKWHNGQGTDFVGHFVQDFDLMSTGQIGNAKRNLDAGNEAGGWRPEWIPFLEDDAGNYLFLDTGQPEPLVREFWQGKSEAPIAARSLTEWLRNLVLGAESGQYREDPERGSFLRRSS